MTAFEFLAGKIPNLTESSQLRWRNPDYASAKYRSARDICAEMEQFVSDVIEVLRGYNQTASDAEIRQSCFEKCFGHIVMDDPSMSEIPFHGSGLHINLQNNNDKESVFKFLELSKSALKQQPSSQFWKDAVSFIEMKYKRMKT